MTEPIDFCGPREVPKVDHVAEALDALMFDVNVSQPGDAARSAIAFAILALVEEVKGLRKDLQERGDTVATCPHGTTGLCMACVVTRMDECGGCK